MKLFHTADWHIGKLVHKLYMTEDQAYLLDQLTEHIKTGKPDVLLIAGDVYDRSIPPASAVELLDRFFTRIITETSTKILVISGNHDSPDRLNFGSGILQKQGLHIITQVKDIFKPILHKDAHGDLCFYCIPFLEPEIIRDYFEDDQIKSHDDAMKRIMAELDVDPSKRNICLAHGYITAGDALEESDSEKPLAIGGSSYIGSHYFKAFDYVALGHLHGPQRVGSDTIRYGGSLMKYSFSEVHQKKGVQVVELGAKGTVQLSQIPFKPLRDFRVIKGKIDHLLDKEVYSLGDTNDYIKAILTDQGEIINAFSKLKAVYPNILSVEFERMELLDDREFDLDSRAVSQKNPQDLFVDFYEWVEREPINDAALTSFGKACDRVQRKERESE